MSSAARDAQTKLKALATAVAVYFDDDKRDPEIQKSQASTLHTYARSILDPSLDPKRTPLPGELTPEQIADPGRFFCPHCGAFRPGYGFNYQRHALPGIGVVGYFIIFCSAEDCRKIVSTALIEFQPDPSAIAAAQREGPRIIS